MMPFLYRNETTNLWVVVVAQFDLTWAQVAWMELDELKGEILRPTVDVVEEVHTFPNLAGAKLWIQHWWKNKDN